MKTIIFLDIDGVLNCEKGWESYIDTNITLPKYKWGYTGIPFYSKAVSLLNELVHFTQAEIVVISTWRIGQTVEELQMALNERGVRCKVIDKTECLGIKRGEEIQLWLDNNGPIGKYVIIDDNCSYDIIGCFTWDVCVQPSEPEGFNEECFLKAIDIIA